MDGGCDSVCTPHDCDCNTATSVCCSHWSSDEEEEEVTGDIISNHYSLETLFANDTTV